MWIRPPNPRCCQLPMKIRQIPSILQWIFLKDPQVLPRLPTSPNFRSTTTFGDSLETMVADCTLFNARENQELIETHVFFPSFSVFQSCSEHFLAWNWDFCTYHLVSMIWKVAMDRAGLLKLAFGTMTMVLAKNFGQRCWRAHHVCRCQCLLDGIKVGCTLNTSWKLWVCFCL